VSDSVDVLIVSSSLPTVAHPGDAGADLSSAEAFDLAPGERRTVRTGVSIALPRGYVAFIVPRSGLAARHGITVVNSPGTVDAGYRGEISVTLLNTDSATSFRVDVGDRIAQMVVLPFSTVNFVPVERLPESARGTDGFGSTGVRPALPTVKESR
jgi:dUTP pyrophosphatase